MPGPEVVCSYKQLSAVERAFRSLTTVDLHVRPIHPHVPDRVRAHVFLCLPAFYVEWHMRTKLAPILFDDHDKASDEAGRESIVKPAQRSKAARRKVSAKRTVDGLPVHSFQSLLADLATMTLNRVQPQDKALPTFDKLANATPLQKRASSPLGVRVKLSKL